MRQTPKKTKNENRLHVTDASAMLIEAYYRALCAPAPDGAPPLIGLRGCYVVDFDALCHGDERTAEVVAAALRIPAEKVMAARVKGCPQSNYSEPEMLIATQFFAGRSMLYPHAALEYDPNWHGQDAGRNL